MNDKPQDLVNLLSTGLSDPLTNMSVPDKKRKVEKLEIKAQENIGRDTIIGAAAKFGEVTDKYLNNFEADRVELEEVINHLKDVVFNSAEVKGFFVENLVGALKVKSETNSNITKVLDSIAKLISAGKGELFIKRTTTDYSELAKLLQEE